MDETEQNELPDNPEMEDNMQIRRNKRRSSILKPRKLKNLSNETSNTASPEVAMKSVRRVSFAPSNFVKPFVSDPDKNTIWDTTYEEEVNHTDSTKSSQEKTDLNTTTINSELHTINYDQTCEEYRTTNTMYKNMMEITNITNHSVASVRDMEITAGLSAYIVDKENINSKESLIDYVRRLRLESANKNEEQTKLANDNNDVSMELDQSDMQFTCQVPQGVIFQNSNHTTKFEETKMQFTCQFVHNEIQCGWQAPQLEVSQPLDIYKANISNKSLRIRDKLEESDMEFTCQVPQHRSMRTDNKTTTKNDERQLRDKLQESDMEFTCQVPQRRSMRSRNKTTTKNDEMQVQKKLGESQMEFTCQVPPQQLENRDKLQESDMEFTCQVPQDRSMRPDNKTATKNDERQLRDKLQESDMEFTCQVPQRRSMRSRNKTTTKNDEMQVQNKLGESQMEFACQVPQQQLENGDELQESDMEFTCQVPQHRSMRTTNKTTTNNDETQLRDKLQESDMEFTCQVSQRRSMSSRNKTTTKNDEIQVQNKLEESQMEFTCQIPSQQLENRDELQESDMEFTCQVPQHRSMRTANKTTTKNETQLRDKLQERDMEFTCQVPQSRNKPTRNKTTTKNGEIQIQNKLGESQMEFTCQVPQEQLQIRDKLTDSDMEFTCQVPQHRSMRIGNKTTTENDETQLRDKLQESDMEFICQVPQSRSMPTRNKTTTKNDQTQLRDKLQDSDMEFTCQVPQSRNMHTRNKATTENDEVQVQNKLGESQMEFTCQVPQQQLQIRDKLAESDMEFTCQVPQHRSMRTANKTTTKNDESQFRDKLQESDMEFTCQVPQSRCMRARNKATLKNVEIQLQHKLGESQMELTSQVLQQQLQSRDKLQESDMEFTCQVPQTRSMRAANKTTKNDQVQLQRKLGESQMEFTCEIRQQIRDKLAESDMEFTCQVPQTRSMRIANKTINDQIQVQNKLGESQMEFTSQVPQQQLPIRDKLEKSDMEFTCQIPQRSKRTVRIQDNLDETAMEFTCRVPNSGTPQNTMAVRRNEIESNQNIMELTCQNPTNVEKAPAGDLNKIIETSLATIASNPNDTVANENQTHSDEMNPIPIIVDPIDRKGHVSLFRNENYLSLLKVPEGRAMSEDINTDQVKVNLHIDSSSSGLYMDCGNSINAIRSLPAIHKTPDPSFHINLTNINSSTDDTQHLIYYTFNKSQPELQAKNDTQHGKLELTTNPVGDVSRPNINFSKLDCCQNDDDISTEANNSSVYPQTRDNMSFIPNRLTTTNDTYVLKSRTTIVPKATIPSTTIQDESMVDLVPSSIDSDDCSDCDFSLTNEVCRKYFPLKPFKLKTRQHKDSTLLKDIKEQRQHIRSYLENLIVQQVQVPECLPECIDSDDDIEPLSKEETAMAPATLTLSSGDESSMTDVKKIKEAEERCGNIWKLEKIENDRHHFNTLVGSLTCIVEVDPPSGIVTGIETKKNLQETYKPLANYLRDYLSEKIKHNKLRSVLGHGYDILSLLDYVTMNVLRIKEFSNEAVEMLKYGATFGPDFMTFKIHNFNLILLLEVTVDMRKIDQLDEDDVQVKATIGQIRDSYAGDIRKLAKTCPKGLDFFMSYIQAVEDYLKGKEKYLKSKK